MVTCRWCAPSTQGKLCQLLQRRRTLLLKLFRLRLELPGESCLLVSELLLQTCTLLLGFTQSLLDLDEEGVEGLLALRKLGGGLLPCSLELGVVLGLPFRLELGNLRVDLLLR